MCFIVIMLKLFFTFQVKVDKVQGVIYLRNYSEDFWFKIHTSNIRVILLMEELLIELRAGSSCAIDFQTESVLAINQKLKFLIHFQFFI